MIEALAVDVGTTTTAAAIWRDGAATVLPLSIGPDGPDTEAGADTLPTMPGPADLTIGRVLQQTTRLSGRPSRLLLTAPTWWPERRRELLRNTGYAAGGSDVRVIPGTVAAATYHDHGRPLEPGAAVVVVDLGAGGSDAAVLVRTGRGFELCAEPVGDDRVGGAAFDRALAGVIARCLPDGDPVAALAVAPTVKHALCAQNVVDLASWIPVDEPVLLTRDRFEDAIRDDVVATVDRLRTALRDAEIDPRLLTAVLLAGGSSRIPLVVDQVRAGLGVTPTLLDRPKVGVCLGAVIADVRGRAAAAPAAAGDTVGVGPATPARVAPPVDLPLIPAGPHWARPSPAVREPAITVRLDEVRATGRGRLLLLLGLATVVLVVAVVLLAGRR